MAKAKALMQGQAYWWHREEQRAIGGGLAKMDRSVGGLMLVKST